MAVKTLSWWRKRLSTLTLGCVALLAASHTPAQAPPLDSPSPSAYPLTVDRGAVGLRQTLRKLHTRASLIMIVAHPDDEDGGLLTYESRGQGADATLLTLNRGEGGQNAMSADLWDQLGVLRTQELLAADEYYGVHQYFTRVVDFGFSKTIEESMKTWGHDRVLYDAVRVVRMTRPLIVTSSFSGNVSDGHGQHQVSGAIAQEVYKAAADPSVFPDQIEAGLPPWAPLKVYARVPFARASEKGIYDSATGRWEPVRFRNYVDGTYIEGVPSETVSVPEGELDEVLGTSYFNFGRQGLGQQKSQVGGIVVPPLKPVFTPYHLYASRVSSTLPSREASLFEGIDTSLAGIAGYAPVDEQKPWRDRLVALNSLVDKATAAMDPADPAKIAPLLAEGLSRVNSLLLDLQSSKLNAAAKYDMQHELGVKQRQFNLALQQALGINVLATMTNTAGGLKPADEPAFQAAIPGQTFKVRLQVANGGSQPITVTVTRLKSHAGPGWSFTPDSSTSQDLAPVLIKPGDTSDTYVTVTVPEKAELTQPYFSRPTFAQSYYNIDDQRYLDLPSAPYPLSAELSYTYRGVTAPMSAVVQTIHTLSGSPSTFQPLMVAPAISITVSPEAGIVPLSSTTFHLDVTVHSSVKGSARGAVRLQLPPAWKSSPVAANYQTTKDGDDQIVGFEVTPSSVQQRSYTIHAVADYGGRQYKEGFELAGYPGLQPYPSYRPATYRASGVDVRVAPSLKIGYIMGTGDDVPRSMQDLGLHPTLLSARDLASGDLSAYDAIVVGIRAYAARPDLKTAKDRLIDYARHGGAVIVQYQTGGFDEAYGPYRLTLSGSPEKVVEEDGEASILAPEDPLFSWPNKISSADFSGWVEERGHGFMQSWDPHFITLIEMHDAKQEPQKGGLLYARCGQGFYIYTAFSFFRQMPEGVPGPFRIFANLISAGKNPALRSRAALIR